MRVLMISPGFPTEMPLFTRGLARVGAEVYGRFSAPMREIVGVFLHRELLERLREKGGRDDGLRAAVVAAAVRASTARR